MTGSTATIVPRSCMFGALCVEYDERVLEPRPWTVLQSEWAAAEAELAPPGPILELCAGAGQIGLLAAKLACRSLVQVEADVVAAGFARRNAATAEVESEVRNARIEHALDPAERFPIILADPPYLPTEQIGRFPADPVTAIDGGGDGLELLRLCLALTHDHLDAEGFAIFQVAGPAQAVQLAGLSAAGGLLAVARRIVDDERALVLLRRA